MNLDEAVEAWRRKAASIPNGGPNLPYASLVAVTLAGHARDPFAVGVLANFAVSPYGASEVPMDMSAARCKGIDSQFYDEFVRMRGGRPKGANVMEASWLATDVALYYIAPAVAGRRRWLWKDLRIEPGRTGRRTAKFALASGRERWQCSTGARALPNLLACASWAEMG